MSEHEGEYDKGIVENAGAPIPGQEREAVHEAGLGGGTGDLGGGGGVGGDPVGREGGVPIEETGVPIPGEHRPPLVGDDETEEDDE